MIGKRSGRLEAQIALSKMRIAGVDVRRVGYDR